MTSILLMVLSTSLTMAVQAAILLAVAFLLVLVLGFEHAGTTDQGAIVVSVAVVGGIALEVLGGRFVPWLSRQLPGTVSGYVTSATVWRFVSSPLRLVRRRPRAIGGGFMLHCPGHEDILRRELAREEDLVNLIVDSRRASERKRFVRLAIRRLQEDAKGSPVGGLAVLQPETPPWRFPYLLGYELARELGVKVDFVEKIDMQIGFRSSIGAIGGSKYVGILRLDEWGEPLEQQLKDCLAETTGAKVGRTFTLRNLRSSYRLV